VDKGGGGAWTTSFPVFYHWKQERAQAQQQLTSLFGNEMEKAEEKMSTCHREAKKRKLKYYHACRRQQQKTNKH
jgi:hypothetical protein